MNERMSAPDPDQIKAMSPEQLLKQFDRLIWKMVRRYARVTEQYSWIDESDLYQVASIALLRAQKSHDPEGESAFTNYACTIMRREIMRALRIQRTPDGCKFEPVPISLDEPISENGEETRGDLIPGTDIPLEELAEMTELAAHIRKAVHSLPEIEEEIIFRLYLNDPVETRKQIASEKGVSDSDINNRRKRALRKLRYKLRNLQADMPRHIGLKEFNTHWTTEPEQFAIDQEKNLLSWYNDYSKFITDTFKERTESNEKPVEQSICPGE